MPDADQAPACGGRPSCRAQKSLSNDSAATTSPPTTPQHRTATPLPGSFRPSKPPQPPACANHWKEVGPSDAGLQPSQHLESYLPKNRNPSDSTNLCTAL